MAGIRNLIASGIVLQLSLFHDQQDLLYLIRRYAAYQSQILELEASSISNFYLENIQITKNKP